MLHRNVLCWYYGSFQEDKGFTQIYGGNNDTFSVSSLHDLAVDLGEKSWSGHTQLTRATSSAWGF